MELFYKACIAEAVVAMLIDDEVFYHLAVVDASYLYKSVSKVDVFLTGLEISWGMVVYEHELGGFLLQGDAKNVGRFTGYFPETA